MLPKVVNWFNMNHATNFVLAGSPRQCHEPSTEFIRHTPPRILSEAGPRAWETTGPIVLHEKASTKKLTFLDDGLGLNDRKYPSLRIQLQISCHRRLGNSTSPVLCGVRRIRRYKPWSALLCWGLVIVRWRLFHLHPSGPLSQVNALRLYSAYCETHPGESKLVFLDIQYSSCPQNADHCEQHDVSRRLPALEESRWGFKAAKEAGLACYSTDRLPVKVENFFLLTWK
jgi:hypothetical protein